MPTTSHSVNSVNQNDRSHNSFDTSHTESTREACLPHGSSASVARQATLSLDQIDHLQNTVSLTSTTFGSLSLRSSPSELSPQDSAIVGVSEFDRTRSTPRTLRKRHRLSDLHQNDSRSQIQTTESPLEDTADKPKTPTKSYAAFKNMAARAHPAFSSPDRYMSIRAEIDVNGSPLMTTLQAEILTQRERYHRHRDDTVDPFRVQSLGISQRNVRSPSTNRRQHIRASHYTPSFVRPLNVNAPTVGVQTESPLYQPANTGVVWTIGSRDTVSDDVHGVDLGTGMMMASGSTAPMMMADFHSIRGTNDQDRNHEKRIALALEIDQARRILPITGPSLYPMSDLVMRYKSVDWQSGSWTQNHSLQDRLLRRRMSLIRPEKVVPSIAFRVLDAPRLKDDYYCSVLAYSKSCRILAVALTHRVYLWTEQYGVRYPPIPPVRPANYVMSLSFSSDDGGKAILAVARSSGHVSLWSLLEQKVRFELKHPSAACCVSFSPRVTRRDSVSQNAVVDCEDLLVGDDTGRLYYYSVEWPNEARGSATLIAKLQAHSQNICGLAWSPDGRTFVSGGNDNIAALFVTKDVLKEQDTISKSAALAGLRKADGRTSSSMPPQWPETSSSSSGGLPPSIVSTLRRDQETRDILGIGFNISLVDIEQPSSRALHSSSVEAPFTPPRSPPGRRQPAQPSLVEPHIPGLSGMSRHIFRHSAAIKAIAFAPWQPTLLATGGGSNDRQIHFHHTESGSTLAVINVSAQITSLVWSTTRREIVATFGYAQPEHAIRIAVFAWPSCECVVNIPWERKLNGEIGRALWAIPYPGGPNDSRPVIRPPLGNGSDAFGTAARQEGRGRALTRHGLLTPETSPEREYQSRAVTRYKSKSRSPGRTEGEAWASRTEDEGSLIIACCDQTVKFFEIWAGKSKGKTDGLGSKAGVLGGSKVLEGWCESVGIEEVGNGEEVIR